MIKTKEEKFVVAEKKIPLIFNSAFLSSIADRDLSVWSLHLHRIDVDDDDDTIPYYIVHKTMSLLRYQHHH